jgi:hypothetical protein
MLEPSIESSSGIAGLSLFLEYGIYINTQNTMVSEEYVKIGPCPSKIKYKTQ